MSKRIIQSDVYKLQPAIAKSLIGLGDAAAIVTINAWNRIAVGFHFAPAF